MNNPKVSICLCTHNGERFVQELLESVISQSYENIEIIVADDTSSDQTVKILKRFKGRRGLRIFEHRKNLGFRRNFEFAVQKASGDLIALCDQDDIWHRDKISLLVTSVAEAKLIYHDSALIEADGTTLNKTIMSKKRPIVGSRALPFCVDNCISSHALKFRREILQQALPFPRYVFNDCWLGFVSANLGEIKYLDAPLVEYRQHKGTYTDMSGLKQENRNKYLVKIEKLQAKAANKLLMLREFAAFNAQSLENQKVLSRLVDGYARKDSAFFFSLRLFFTYLRNLRRLLAFSHGNFIHRISFAFRESVSNRLKIREYRLRLKIAGWFGRS